MGTLFFVVGCAAGAVVSWFVGCRDRSRSTVAVVSGVAGGLLGMVMSASWGTTTPMTEAAFGLLGTAAPLTLCMTSLSPTATRAEILSAVRYVAARLGIALVCGISCAIAGFVSVESLRCLEVKENEGMAAQYPELVALKPVGDFGSGRS